MIHDFTSIVICLYYIIVKRYWTIEKCVRPAETKVIYKTTAIKFSFCFYFRKDMIKHLKNKRWLDLSYLCYLFWRLLYFRYDNQVNNSPRENNISYSLLTISMTLLKVISIVTFTVSELFFTGRTRLDDRFECKRYPINFDRISKVDPSKRIAEVW
jgi:hypothetical protein